METATTELDATRARLVALLQEHEILPRNLPPDAANTSIFDSGLTDSMGVVHMLELVHQEYGVEIAPDLLVGELTNLDAICEYILTHG